MEKHFEWKDVIIHRKWNKSKITLPNPQPQRQFVT